MKQRWTQMAWRKLAFAAPLAVAAVSVGTALSVRPATAADEDASFNERCATRLAISFLGTSPSETMLASKNPQAEFVDIFLNDSAFIERFSRFINASFNSGAGVLPEHDAVYFAAKHVLTNRKPWSDMFVGKFNVTVVADKGVQVLPDPEGLGYFRSTPWLTRYAGNEATGIKLVTAYRMMQNTVGIHLVAFSNDSEETDISATGRQAAGCANCHYNNWYALDKVASVLSKRVDSDQGVTFEPYTGGPKQLLDGVAISNDKDLVESLVASEDFTFNACRLAFQFLYGRAENACEGPIFDRCVDVFREKQTIQSAVAVVANHPAFCQ